MTENTSQKASAIPLFDFTTMARAIATIQRNQPFIGAEMPKLMKGLELSSEKASADLNMVEASLLALTAFDIALDKKAPPGVRVVVASLKWSQA